MADGIRVDRLAQQLGIPPSDIIARCRANGLGRTVSHEQAVLSGDLLLAVQAWFAPHAGPKGTTPKRRREQASKRRTTALRKPSRPTHVEPYDISGSPDDCANGDVYALAEPAASLEHGYDLAPMHLLMAEVAAADSLVQTLAPCVEELETLRRNAQEATEPAPAAANPEPITAGVAAEPEALEHAKLHAGAEPAEAGNSEPNAEQPDPVVPASAEDKSPVAPVDADESLPQADPEPLSVAREPEAPAPPGAEAVEPATVAPVAAVEQEQKSSEPSLAEQPTPPAPTATGPRTPRAPVPLQNPIGIRQRLPGNPKFPQHVPPKPSPRNPWTPNRNRHRPGNPRYQSNKNRPQHPPLRCACRRSPTASGD